ncbi:MAG: peptide-methionine (S)-S-oxide reductase MsrA [Gemmatimonadaceae bacterium]
METATFAGGCFWCLDSVYRELRGITLVESGYAGGHTENPTYKDVCSGTTGHAEVVQITYDPSAISYRDLLDVFFTIHDPTTLNRQGGDRGTQYRSAIFHHSPEQQHIANETIEELAAAKTWADPIVTELVPIADFHPAEQHHQGYYGRNAEQPYCQVVIAPKIAKARKRFFDHLRK